LNKPDGYHGLEVAVIGMAGRFPGAPDIETLWKNLQSGVSGITFFSDQELKAVGVSDQWLENPQYVKAMPVLTDKDYFDAPFFGYTPAEAELLSPQTRLFMECCWTALEDAGYDPLAYPGMIGCYVGSSSGFPWEAFLLSSGKSRDLGDWTTHMLADKDNLASMLAYKFDFKGPSLTFFSACSTSLLAVHLGCRALLTGECQMAVAGGVRLDTTAKPGYLFQPGMMLSPDGLCRAFDEKAAGTIFGEGLGVVVLKRFPDALADGDHIYAVVRGSAANNDGRNRVGYTAPGMRGEAEVIRLALKVARVPVESITYIEAHGTGTALGDAIEIAALKEVFQTDKKRFCAIGSIKTNIGHLEAAAGVAGFIKTVLCLRERQIPKSLHFQVPHPALAIEGSPFYVNTALQPWQGSSYPRRAGVNSFGIGGTNVHIILEEAPQIEAGSAFAGKGYELLVLSARSQTALDRLTLNLADYLRENPHIDLSAVAYTLQVGRRAFPYRRLAVCRDAAGAVSLLSDPGGDGMKSSILAEGKPDIPLVFLFPGLGAQYSDMGRELYEQVPQFQAEMDTCFELVKPLLGQDIKAILYPQSSPGPGQPITPVEIAQVSLFILEYGLAKLLRRWGITPTAVIGYSFGEYAAACVAGVFSLEDTLKLVISRARSMETLAPGAMLSVPVDRSALTALFSENTDLELFLAIDNGLTCVVTGKPADVAGFGERLKAKRLVCLPVPGSRPLHSPLMSPIRGAFETTVRGLRRHEPEVVYFSGVTGDQVKTGQAVDPSFWSSHLENSVLFADCCKKAIEKWGNVLFLELGPGRDLCNLVGRYLGETARERVIPLVRPADSRGSELFFLLLQVGRLWLHGKSPDWGGFYPAPNRRRLPLPAYPFDRYYCPAGGDPRDYEGKWAGGKAAEKKSDIADWFYFPSWKRSLAPGSEGRKPGCPWLVWADRAGLGAAVVKRLVGLSRPVIMVESGSGFSLVREGVYTVNPGVEEDYRALFSLLKGAGQMPEKIVHMWSVTGNEGGGVNRESFDKAQTWGLYSLVYLVRGLSGTGLTGDLEMAVVSNRVQEVTGREVLWPGKATVLSAVRVLAQEYPFVRTQSIDIDWPVQGDGEDGERVLDLLITELMSQMDDPVVAYRDGMRWLPVYEPVRLPKPLSDQSIPRLREKGVYLVTGGLGGLGLCLAGYLARCFRARLVLVGRSGLPPRSDWPDWLSTHGPEDSFNRKITRLVEMEKAGAQVMPVQANVANRREMGDAIRQAEAHFGTINGVIHAAGILGSGKGFATIDRVGREEFSEQFTAKVYGLMVLADLLPPARLDFFLLSSSLSPILGGLGFVAYAAANQFMDTFAAWANRRGGGHILGVNWGDWQPWKESDRASRLGSTLSRWNMEPEEGIETFRRLLGRGGMGQIIVSAGDLEFRLNQWVRLEGVRAESLSPGNRTGFSDRSHLSTPYVPAQTDLEKSLARIWQRLLGYGKIGVQDDFFELGGDSLKATTLLSCLHRDLQVDIPLPGLMTHTTIAQLSVFISHQGAVPPLKESTGDGMRESGLGVGTRNPGIDLLPVEDKEYYELSTQQKRLWVLHEMSPGGSAYHIPVRMALNGGMDVNVLGRVLGHLSDRHESFRTGFRCLDGKLVQFVVANVAMDLDVIDISDLPDAEHRDRKEEIYGQVSRRPFDLGRPPLFRAVLVRESAERGELLFNMHHIISDGWSIEVLRHDFTRVYEALAQGRDAQLDRLLVRYRDFCAWQAVGMSDSEKNREAGEFWERKLNAVIKRAELPEDFPTFRLHPQGAGYWSRLDQEVKERLEQTAREQQTSLFVVLLCGYLWLLARFSSRSDIVCSIINAGREFSCLQEVMGFFVNSVIFRVDVNDREGFADFVERVKGEVKEAFRHQGYPVEQVFPRMNRQYPEINVSFNMLNIQTLTREQAIEFNTPFHVPYTQDTRFDIEPYVKDYLDGLAIFWSYRKALFKPETIEYVGAEYGSILGYFSRNKKNTFLDYLNRHGKREFKRTMR